LSQSFLYCDFRSSTFSMPKVNSYAPAWLCRPSPGASLFTSTSAKSPAQDLQNGANVSGTNGPTRTIAKRGHEVFAVVDNEIRWSNLARLKDQWEREQQGKQKKGSAGQAKGTTGSSEVPPYRVSDELSRIR
jgi:nucleoporin NUP82